MFVVINFNSTCTTAWTVPPDFSSSLPHQGRRFPFQPVRQVNVNEQWWTEGWISRGINVILTLCDYMLGVLYMSINLMWDDTKERASWRKSRRQNVIMLQFTAAPSKECFTLNINFKCRLKLRLCYTIFLHNWTSPKQNVFPCVWLWAFLILLSCYSLLLYPNSYPVPPVLLCWPTRWAMVQSNPENSSAPTSMFPWRTTMYQRSDAAGCCVAVFSSISL